MTEFNREDLQTEYESRLLQRIDYLDALKEIVQQSGASLEGNAFYKHESLDLYPELYTKQLNLLWCGKQAVTRMCEIGFNAGHSSMLLLLGREQTPLDFLIFDIGHHAYTRPCLQYIQSEFSHIKFEYVEGDSTVTIPDWINKHSQWIGSYDVVHVDGGHTEHCIANDMKNADTLLKKGGLLIVDDTYFLHIHMYVEAYIASGKYVEVNILPTVGYQHRVLRKV